MKCQLTHSPAASDEARSLSHEAVDVGEALVPQEDRNVHDVRHKTEGGQRRVKKQCEEAALMSVI